MDGEDFSFPATTHSLPFSIDSPPLWQGPSAASSAPTAAASVGKQEGKGHQNAKGRSLSLDEEKMDMLWEDFNEETWPPLALQRNNGKGSRKMVKMGGCGSIKGWSISSDNSEKLGVVALLKILRKLFLIHGDQSPSPPLKKGRTNAR
ncbi:hypothetical protein SAY86_018869 [Trapa natans]|uniref:Uncharacterized protein n=1 Tax=Trapa natans TaxID=22666 RepID=A0AAN7R252_TRANT|nr:hypothetical protein SAY86_018869 [Trapa natans]